MLPELDMLYPLQRLPISLLLLLFSLELNEKVEGKSNSRSFPGQVQRDDLVTFRIAQQLEVDDPVVNLRNGTFVRGVKYYRIKLFNVISVIISVDALIGNPNGRAHVITAGDRGCPGRMTTTETAHIVGCALATNGGFFNMHSGDCIGNVISRGNLVQLSGIRNVNFGWNSTHYTIGYPTKASVSSRGFIELLAGVIWLVREGRPWWDESALIEAPDFMDMRAPRTVIGHDKIGRMILMVVEGVEIEGAGQGTGLTISEIADLSLRLGMYNAVNLDGGGSSAFVYRGKLINEIDEKCPHNPHLICERPVTTIICIK